MNHAQNRSDGATRPEDQLYQEFESYVQSLYTEASERPLKRLENSIGQVVEKLEAGVRKAMATVDDRSGRLEKLFDQTRREFQTQFGPVLEDYRRQLAEDQARFAGEIAERVQRDQRELHKPLRTDLNLVRQGGEEVRQSAERAFQQADQHAGKLRALVQRAQEDSAAASRDLSKAFREMRDQVGEEIGRLRQASQDCRRQLPGMAAGAANEACAQTMRAFKPFLYFCAAMSFLGLAAGCVAVTLLAVG